MKSVAHILVVEDNRGDQRLITEAFLTVARQHRVHMVSDGASAIDFLRRRESYRDSPTPQLIILDLNLPRLSGYEVLREIKSEPLFRNIPVVVFSSSPRDQDVLQAYDLHANAYVAKPTDLEDFFSAVRAIEQFWCTLACLPAHRE